MAKNSIFRDFHLVESEISLPLIDRIRLIFGSKLFVYMTVATPFRGDIQTKSSIRIEKVFAPRHKVAGASEPV